MIVLSTCVFCSTRFLHPHCPIFLTYEECFTPDQTIIQEISPYVAEWATKPPERTERQRETVEKTAKKFMDIRVGNQYKTSEGETLYIVDIFTDTWYDWWHGYLYVHDGHDLGTEWNGGTLTKINDHWYIYNWND